MANSIITDVTNTIQKYSLCSFTDRIVIGVSGGIDSMVLVHILHSLQYSIAIAHCNFQLRGKESDDDESFVKMYAEKNNIPLYINSWNTNEYAQKHALSVEMAARELRYNWFNTLCETHNFNKIAIAHNANDSIETFFINLLRSSGIRGLIGIPITNKQIIRPLLQVERKDIELYAKTNNIKFRTDSTNAENIYVRNIIRNKILPEFNTIVPSSVSSISKSLDYLKETYEIYKLQIGKDISEIVTETADGLEINEDTLITYPYASTLLFEILMPYGFNSDVILQILQCISGQSGKTFESHTHTIIHDRNKLILKQKKEELFTEIIIPNSVKNTYKLSKNSIEIHEMLLKDSSISKSKKEAFLDKTLLTFPLTIRKWQPGDTFIPFGMRGNKKISDFLIDEKIPLHEKDEVFVLISNNEIVWVIGMRINQKYAVTNNTTSIIHCKIQD